MKVNLTAALQRFTGLENTADQLYYIRISPNMLFLEYPSLGGDEKQNHLGSGCHFADSRKASGFFMSGFCVLSTVSAFCPRLVSPGDPAFPDGAVRVIEALNCPQV